MLFRSLDDALAMGLVRPEDLVSLDLLRQAEADFTRVLQNLTPDQRVRRVAKLLIDVCVRNVLSVSADQIAAHNIQSVDDVRAAPVRLVHFCDDLEPKVLQVEKFLMTQVYRNHRVMRMTTKARRFLLRMADFYQQDVTQLPPNYQLYAAQYGLKRAIADYIAGMTDRFAQDEYRKLFEPFDRL